MPHAKDSPMNKSNKSSWVDAGKQHIWPPYTQVKHAPEPLAIASTKGTRVVLEDGRELLDGIASWWSACHGYNHPRIIKAIQKQAEVMPHVMFAGALHEPASVLAKRLVDIAPQGLGKVFFADSGSVAMEVAMKMAVQYWQNIGVMKRDRFISFRHSYHGDTMGAMSLGDTEDGMHAIFKHYMPMQYSVNIPSDEYSFAEFDELLAAMKKNIAGVVLEPLVQGAGGMKFHTADILAEIYRITKKHDLLFIADEIFTGFGRTGLMFACDEAGITPDIMCVGKALSGGALSLAAVLATDTIFNAFVSDNPKAALMHGPTFMANPIACAAAIASLDLFEAEPRLKQIETIEAQLSEELAPVRHLKGVRDVRVKGAIGVVQLEKEDPSLIRLLRQAFLEKGVWVRPFGDVVYLTPAFVISEKELSTLTQAVHDVLEKQL
jgi:adenosylmethionine-8-amino-7-oxononanoate aminotransferase